MKKGMMVKVPMKLMARKVLLWKSILVNPSFLHSKVVDNLVKNHPNGQYITVGSCVVTCFHHCEVEVAFVIGGNLCFDVGGLL